MTREYLQSRISSPQKVRTDPPVLAEPEATDRFYQYHELLTEQADQYFDSALEEF